MIEADASLLQSDTGATRRRPQRLMERSSGISTAGCARVIGPPREGRDACVRVEPYILTSVRHPFRPPTYISRYGWLGPTKWLLLSSDRNVNQPLVCALAYVCVGVPGHSVRKR